MGRGVRILADSDGNAVLAVDVDVVGFGFGGVGLAAVVGGRWAPGGQRRGCRSRGWRRFGRSRRFGPVVGAGAFVGSVGAAVHVDVEGRVHDSVQDRGTARLGTYEYQSDAWRLVVKFAGLDPRSVISSYNVVGLGEGQVGTLGFPPGSS
jgi:hypothetical protein